MHRRIILGPSGPLAWENSFHPVDTSLSSLGFPSVPRPVLSSPPPTPAPTPFKGPPLFTSILDLLTLCSLCPSKGEARRLIEQGGVSVDETKVTDVNMPVPAKEFVLHKGKKVHVKIIVL